MNMGVQKALLTNKRSSVDYCMSRRRERQGFLSRNNRNSKNHISQGDIDIFEATQRSVSPDRKTASRRSLQTNAFRPDLTQMMKD